MTDKRDRDALRARCTRFVSRQRPPTPKETLRALADHVGDDETADVYGGGRLIADFEDDVARLLGKAAAGFMPSGTMAQAIALRIWADRRHVRTVGLHPLSHLERNEGQAYRDLHGLSAHYLGDDSRQFRRSDLDAVRQDLAAVVVEMPLRPLGHVLLPWTELESMWSWAKERGVALHLDGARIWESQPYYGRSHAGIAALFDTVYVSFYKGLGGLAGSALAGPRDFIDAARIWQHRQGGRLIHLYPYILSARKGLAEKLPSMPALHAKAVAIAEALRDLPGLRVTPDPPHAVAMQIAFPADAERMNEVVLDIAECDGVWLIDRIWASPIQGICLGELTVGAGTLEIADRDIRSLFAHALARLGNRPSML
jgi:threonine aldolase